ncbi:hypothetical protein ACTMTI_00910 [Nonomuraea sp. H19]|uniref:hypothetical protein n=1 Tax=Nonomuraea sp. H19 TaxID=3452206 RepID=UPI003F8A4729
MAEVPDEGDGSGRARLLMESVHLGELDRAADALRAEQEAVAVYRRLAAASPERHRGGLAHSLAGLDTVLSALGRNEASR